MARGWFRLGRDCLCRREAPAVGRFTLPLCWRCSGMTVGAAGMLVIDALGALAVAPVFMAVAGCLCGLPAAADVGFQVITPYRSNRLRRLASGVLLGTGIALLVNVVARWLRGLT
jgi:uncharacterized membrane protein